MRVSEQLEDRLEVGPTKVSLTAQTREQRALGCLLEMFLTDILKETTHAQHKNIQLSREFLQQQNKTKTLCSGLSSVVC